ncbi:MAG: DUF6522 family protein [Paracoccus sp. (in: a-proteobacteria)]|uniref:DUF6522 family protein n=2 Tax=Paracoccus TaxID=265 RepID=UPI00233CFD2E|nr:MULTISPECIES: DUF6522 family protein [unclassified Paracoccus (in: a-proteobacteria)]MDB2490601.1 DUF6522 family protein [Paracoccus sp. (in: a-proteobacteria)]MDB2552648.1 DUF6522 family protein [Paracoccus sp. (in: a-proteobacteria)]
MKLRLTETGVEVAAEDLAPLLELDPSDLRRQMRDGAVTTRYEVGQDADAGRFRVTFQSADWRVRFTCASDGTVLKRLRNRRGG